MAKNDNGVMEFQFYNRPEHRSKWQNFKRAIYDPQSKQCLGRTPKNWGQLLLFYTIFYIVLAALFAVCMQGLFATLDTKEPKWTLGSSLIGTNPGLGFRPISSRTEEGSLISYNLANQSTSEKWVKLVNKFLAPYNKTKTGANYVHCDFNTTLAPDKVCDVTINDLGSCTHLSNYGYNTSSPCVFLKLNRIYGWEPDCNTLPVEGMPKELHDHILSRPKHERKQVWVSCEGQYDTDKENFNDFRYYPHGFAGYYYPYKNVDHYLSPIVAVQILNLKPNQIITIECRAWAKNIEYRGGSLNRAGSITFEVRVDDLQKTTITTTIAPAINSTAI